MFKKTVHSIWPVDYLTTELYHWYKIDTGIITLLMASKVCKIKTHQIYIDFHDRKSCACTRKLQSNLFK